MRKIATRVVLSVSCLSIAAGLMSAAPNQVSAKSDGAEVAEKVQSQLELGLLAQSIKTLNKQLKAKEDAQVRFGLGMVHFMRAFERLNQARYDHGIFQGTARSSGVFGMVAGRGGLPDDFKWQNPKPKSLSYEQSRGILTKFLADLKLAEAELARVPDGVELALQFGKARFDFSGNGQVEEVESLLLFMKMLGGTNLDAKKHAETVIHLDGGDVYWLRGYCNVFMAATEIALAHDWRQLFERTGFLLVTDPVSPHHVVGHQAGMPGNVDEIVDIIALIHLINFPVTEPQRMKNAHAHLLQIPALSRKSWKLILAEKDNQNEWLPNPKQTGIIQGAPVTEAMVQGWMKVMDEFELVLQGKKLIPYWRDGGIVTLGQLMTGRRRGNQNPIAPNQKGLGVNVKKVFHDPKGMDLILWIQGTAATPFLEEGKLSDFNQWRELAEPFDNFGLTAIWFN